LILRVFLLHLGDERAVTVWVSKFKQMCLPLVMGLAVSLTLSLPGHAKPVAPTSHKAKAGKSAKAAASKAKSAKTTLGKHASKHSKHHVSRDPLKGVESARLSAEPARLVPVSVNSSSLPFKPSASGTANMTAASGASGSSFGQLYGLHHTSDPLELKSSVALIMDQDTNEVVFAKNSDAVLPIASLTKLMTAMVMVEAKLPMDENIVVTSDDVDTEKNSSSRLSVGANLTRGELLHLALMSSENRAAHALGRTFPGGLNAFVAAMNNKARTLGMGATGLNSQNQSSAKDLASLVKAAYQQPLIRELSTSHEYAVRVGSRQVQFRNTNSLVRNPAWDIGLQKTGYIVEAGRCLVMQARMAGRKFIKVFLDSTGKYSRQADAERVRRWIETASQRGSVSATQQPRAKVTS